MRAAARESAESVRRWRYLHRVMRTKRKLKVLVYQHTELHPTRYTRDIRDRFELAKTRKLGTSPVVDFPGSYLIKRYPVDLLQQIYAVGMVRFATRTLTLTIFRNRSDDSGSTLRVEPVKKA
jgi:hypothetical protein